MAAPLADILRIDGRELHAGVGAGPLLRLSAPLSFWGGVDPATGRISQVRHPEVGAGVAGTVLVLADPIGSSSSSYVLLELISRGVAPAALVLGAPDAILVVACIVARELGLAPPPVLVVARDRLAALPDGHGRVGEGRLEVRPAQP